MPFNLKNDGATYQQLMDVMFSHHIGKNLEISVDDMTWKTAEGCSHAADLKDDLQSVKTYNLLLNPTKFSFRVQPGSSLDL